MIINFCQRNLFCFVDSEEYSDIDSDTYDTRDRTDTDNTNEPLSSSNIMIYEMLKAGHGLNEPYVQVIERTVRY